MGHIKRGTRRGLHTMDAQYVLVQGLMSRLQGELQRLGLWSDEPPDGEALASEIPFCHDTLDLAEWLQWVFLPTLDEMLDRGAQLPDKCEISTYADMVLPQQVSGLDINNLMKVLQTFDEVLSDPKT